MSGLPESPRWHDHQLWFSDWGAHEVIALDLDGKSEVIARVPSFPMCIDRLPDGRLLIVSASDGLLLCREPDGSLATYADLSDLADHKWNDIVVDGRGNAYVNNIGFDFPGGDFAPGIVALVTPQGSARKVAEGVAFPNGMVVTPDNSTLILAESYGNKLTAFDIAADGSLSNRRVWADLQDGAPDGICLDAEKGRLVRGRAQQALRTRSRRWRGTADDPPRPWLLRLRARRSWQENAVPDGERLARPREHDRRGA
jgi:sugar lactone lactonase YvrE